MHNINNTDLALLNSAVNLVHGVLAMSKLQQLPYPKFQWELLKFWAEKGIEAFFGQPPPDGMPVPPA